MIIPCGLTSVAFGLVIVLVIPHITEWAKQATRGRRLSPSQEIIKLDLAEELAKQFVHSNEVDQITLDEFPYYISEQSKARFRSAGFFTLSRPDLSRHTKNMSHRTVLISGPVEIYQQCLAQALANSFDSKLLVFNVHAFSLQISRKHGATTRDNKSGKSFISGIFRSFAFLRKKRGKAQINRRSIISVFDDELVMDAIYQVLSETSSTSPVVLYVRDVDKLFNRSQRIPILFQMMLKKLEGRVDSWFKNYKTGGLVSWNCRLLEDDVLLIQREDKIIHVSKVLTARKIECDDLDSLSVKDTIALSDDIEEIIPIAILLQLNQDENLEYKDGKLVISAGSLKIGLMSFNSSKYTGTAQPDNEYEKRIRSEVIPANKIDVTFEDIGALNDVKESLEEIVMLPIKRPDLFKGGMLTPCKGVLLFGPPGTGKTMLAKAIAKEAGASFINISVSVIASKLVGEYEKNIRAAFSLAAKLSPAIIFIDEVDGLLSRRRTAEAEYIRQMKNEFMVNWDGLTTKADQQIVVLGATNRPFDLDEAAIRRFERRIMVDLPNTKNREAIFKTLLRKEVRQDVKLDSEKLANMTEGYSGSDIKNLCSAAARRPVRELIQREKLKDSEKESKAESSDIVSKNDKEESVMAAAIRPLTMEDFKEAKNEIRASVPWDGEEMDSLREWNKKYGGGRRGSVNSPILSYFL